MRNWLFIGMFYWMNAIAQDVHELPIYVQHDNMKASVDWLIQSSPTRAGVYRDSGTKTIILSNGLIQRSFILKPALSCVDFKNLVSGEQLIRAIQPEARIIINGKSYNVGGLSGQHEKAYLLPEWANGMRTEKDDFNFKNYEIKPLSPFLHWKSSTWTGHSQQASGIEISFHYYSTAQELTGLYLSVHYALYDGMPLVAKWISIHNESNNACTLNRVVNELLATPEEESAVVGETGQIRKPHGIYVETNYAFNNAMRYDLSDQTTHWKADSSYTSQVNYNYQTPCLLEIYPEKGPGIMLNQGDEFQSIISWELLLDGYDRERNGLAIRKMYRTVAPWTTQNPIFMHLVSKQDEEVRQAVDQCASTGYEALILSFGSHCNMEDTTATNIRKWKSLADYAHQKNILIGGYSLFSSRQISDEDDVIDPVSGKPDAAAFFGHAPCYGSKWGLAYLQKIKYFISKTGFNLFENDGPYPGDVCASAHHPGHIGLDDSQWRQMELQKSLYHWCNEHGIYVNAPDWYFMDGTNKIALGYREVNFALPREQQLILNRQNIFDGTWEKTVSMSWGFVPLTAYHGGGPESVLEPLSEHIRDYEQLMMQYYGAGVQACYRGPRLFDTDKTKEVVVRVIDWYKKYRTILNADLIHLRRADGRDWDGWMHVDPSGQIKGMVMLFNPLKQKISRTIRLPLYYTGLQKEAKISEQGGKEIVYPLERDYSIHLKLNLNPNSYTWIIIR